jgi:transposase
LRDTSKHVQRIGLDIKPNEVSGAKKKKKEEKQEECASKRRERDSNDRLHEMSVNISSSLVIHPSTRVSREEYSSSSLKLVCCFDRNTHA